MAHILNLSQFVLGAHKYWQVKLLMENAIWLLKSSKWNVASQQVKMIQPSTSHLTRTFFSASYSAFLSVSLPFSIFFSSFFDSQSNKRQGLRNLLQNENNEFWPHKILHRSKRLIIFADFINDWLDNLKWFIFSGPQTEGRSDKVRYTSHSYSTCIAKVVWKCIACNLCG